LGHMRLKEEKHRAFYQAGIWYNNLVMVFQSYKTSTLFIKVERYILNQRGSQNQLEQPIQWGKEQKRKRKARTYQCINTN